MDEWLLTAPDPCPFCGERAAPDDERCGACGRALVVRYRPQQRSAAVTTIAGLWGLAGGAALLMAAGALVQPAAQAPAADASGGGQIMRSLARVLGVAALDAPVASAPPPAWLVPALAAGAVAAGAVAWLAWSRRPAALYAWLAAAALLAIGGAAGGALLRSLWPAAGAAAGALALAGVLGGGAVALTHLGAARELLGERRRLDGRAHGTSAPMLHREAQALYEAGMTFAAARAWAQALGRDPGNSAYRRALERAAAELPHGAQRPPGG